MWTEQSHGGRVWPDLPGCAPALPYKSRPDPRQQPRRSVRLFYLPKTNSTSAGKSLLALYRPVSRFVTTHSCLYALEAPLFGLLGGPLGEHSNLLSARLTAFPMPLQHGSKLLSGLDLLADEVGLFWIQEARMGLVLYGAGKAEVRAMTSIGVFTTGTPGLAALDHAFGQRASAHGLCFNQFGGELAVTGGRRLIVHISVLQLWMP